MPQIPGFGFKGLNTYDTVAIVEVASLFCHAGILGAAASPVDVDMAPLSIVAACCFVSVLLLDLVSVKLPGGGLSGNEDTWKQLHEWSQTTE